MKKILIAAALTLVAMPAFAQYNQSGQQAGGPLAGAQRRMGAPGGAPATYGPGPGTVRVYRHRPMRHYYRPHHRYHRY